MNRLYLHNVSQVYLVADLNAQTLNLEQMKIEAKNLNEPQKPPLQQTAVRRSFLQEFDYPLDKIQRKWLRRSITLLFSPILIIAGALFGAFEMGKQWFDECW